MKKIIGILLASMMLVTSLFAFACSAKANLVVLTEYELTAESYAFCVAKSEGQTENPIKKAANDLLKELKQNGNLDKIINSFFDGTSEFSYENPVATTTDHDEYLIVATNAYFPPFEYIDGNKFTGVDIEIASLLAAKLNKTLFVLNEEFDSVIPSVTTGQADIGMAGLTVNDQRKLVVDFSEEYYESAQVLMYKEGDKTFAECKSAQDIENVLKAQSRDFKVGTQKATTGYMYCAGDEDFGYDGYKNLTTKSYDVGALAAKDLQNGAINAVIIDKQPAIAIAKSING